MWCIACQAQPAYRYLSIVFCLFLFWSPHKGRREVFIYYILLAVLLTAAVVSDIRTYRIPNALNALGCLTGMTYGVASGGVGGLCRSFMGIIVPAALLMVLFVLRVIGAGDIKLLSAIGAFVSLDIIKIIVISFVLTALYGIGTVVLGYCRHSKRGFTKIHLSIPIMFGTILYLAGGILLEL